MLRSVLRGCLKKPLIFLLCLILLSCAVTSALLFVPLSMQIKQADIINEDDYLTVAVPDFTYFSGASGYNFGRILQNGGVEQLSSVKQVDHRTAIYAYSPTLKPVTVLEHTHEDEVGYSAVMPSAFFVGTIVCERQEQIVEPYSTQLTMYRNQYEARIVEPIILYEDYADVRNMTVFVDHYEAELMEIGKTYLVWGMLAVDEQNRAELHMRDHNTTLPHGVYREENNGFHWKMQQYPDDFVFPWISEVGGSLDEFLSTELGKHWKEDILDKGDVSLHSTWLIGTDCVESILSFNRGMSYITQGITIDEADSPYVCMISEELAERNALTVGDELALSMYSNGYTYSYNNGSSVVVDYDTTYVPYKGFAEQHAYRIVGIYRTEDDIHDRHAIHPNTIFVPNSSLQGFYPPYMAGDTRIADSSYMVDMEYSMIIPTGAEELFRSEVKMLGMDPEAFLFGDNGYAKDRAQLGAADDALETVRERTAETSRVWYIIPLLTLLASLLAVVWSAGSQVNAMYAVDTPNSKLFRYLYLRQALIILVSGAVSVGLAALLHRSFALWWLSLFASESQAKTVITYLPDAPTVTAALTVIALCLFIAIPMAWLATRRKYHYAYHDTAEQKEVR